MTELRIFPVDKPDPPGLNQNGPPALVFACFTMQGEGIASPTKTRVQINAGGVQRHNKPQLKRIKSNVIHGWWASWREENQTLCNPHKTWISGGEEEDRTPDLRIANATLSQLSYPPTTTRSLAIGPASGLVARGRLGR